MKKVLETNIYVAQFERKHDWKIQNERVVDMFMEHKSTHVSVKVESNQRRTFKATLVETTTMDGLKYYHIQVHSS